MEIELNKLQVSAKTADDLVDKIANIIHIASEGMAYTEPVTKPVEEPVTDLVVSTKPAKPKLSDNIIAVDDVVGKPGETVSVKVTGGTRVPIDGFAFAVGYGHKLKFKGIKLGQWFEDYLGSLKTFQTANVPAGYPGPFVKAFLGFFGHDDNNVTSIAKSLVLPQDTVLATIDLEIPSDASSGAEYTLYNATRWFKNTSQTNNMLKTVALYPTQPDVSAHGIEPVLISGSVKVL